MVLCISREEFSELSTDPTDRLLINSGGEETEMKQEIGSIALLYTFW